MKFKDKYECFKYFKEMLAVNHINIQDYKEINYGLQFSVVLEGKPHVVRIYESKKNGVKPDFSQVKNAEITSMLMDIVYNTGMGVKQEENKVQDKTIVKEVGVGVADREEVALIGTDESGKGDYFGPLVIAGVYADAEAKAALRRLGTDDSKRLKDGRIEIIAQEIKKLCRYEIVVVSNEKYNQLYENVGNLNKLLAWGHARVIENILADTECGVALSDQFGSPSLIENALMEKGRQIHLEQRPRAEENVVVAAASILARNAFVEKMRELEERYAMAFPKGASNMTVSAARDFVLKHGKENLKDVAKLHFKITPGL